MISLTKLIRFTTVNSYRYIPQEPQVNALRGQMLFRSKNLGVRQLDLVIGTWAKLNLPSYTHEQLITFYEQVIKQETPVLVKKMMGQTQIPAQQKLIQQIRDFAINGAFSKVENT